MAVEVLPVLELDEDGVALRRVEESEGQLATQVSGGRARRGLPAGLEMVAISMKTPGFGGAGDTGGNEPFWWWVW